MFEKRKTDKLNTSRKTVIRITALLAILGILAGSFLLPLSTKAQGDESKVVRVGWFDSAYCYKDQFGRRTGLAYEYQQKIAAYTGWTYEYVEGTWPELMQMLINGEIDLLSDVSYTMERSVKILYPRVPMGSESYYIFVKAGNDEMSLDDLSTFNGKVFAVDKGTIMKSLIKEWAGKYGIDIELKEFEDKSIDECFEMVDRGEVDAYVTIESYGNRKNTVPLCSIGSSDYYFGVSKKRPDLLKELNYALTSIQNEDPYYSQKLSQK